MLPSKAIVIAQSSGVLPHVSLANRGLLPHALDWLSAGGVREVAIVADAAVASRARASAAQSEQGLQPRWVEPAAGAPFWVSCNELDDFLGGEPFLLHLADSLSKQSLSSLGSQLSPADDGEVVVATSGGAATGDGAVIDIHERRRPEPFAGIAAVGSAARDVMAALDCAADPRLDRLASCARQGGARVRTLAIEPSWRLSPGTDALLDGNRFALESLRPDHHRAAMVDAEIQGPVVLHPSVHVESSLIRGPVIVGPGARIADAYIGPYTSVGSEVMVEGAEIENSILLEGAAVTHVGARLEASIVGPNARVSRDFRLPKALRVLIGEGAEIALT